MREVYVRAVGFALHGLDGIRLTSVYVSCLLRVTVYVDIHI
jgi:hypothetical protein